MRHRRRGMTLMETVVAGLLTVLFVGSMTTSLATFFLRSIKQERRGAAQEIALQTLNVQQQRAFDWELGSHPLDPQVQSEVEYALSLDVAEVTGFSADEYRRLEVAVSWRDRQGNHLLRKREEVVRATNAP